MDNYYQQPPPIQQPQQVNPTVPPVPEPPKTFGWFKWVLIVVIVSLLSSGTTYFVMNQSQKSQQPPQVTQTNPTPTDLYREPTGSAATANWKTYTNEGYRFIIKYPEGWFIDENNPQSLDEVVYQVFRDRKSREMFLRIIKADSNLLNLDDIGSHQTRDYKDIDGITGTLYRTDYTGIAGAFFREDFIFSKNNNKYWLMFRTYMDDKDASSQLFDQILSTFRFLDQTSYICPATEWVDCMPKIVPGGGPFENPQCDKEYLAWAKTNCPGFQGATY